MLSNRSSFFQTCSWQSPRGFLTPETHFSRVTYGTKAAEAGIAFSSSPGSWNTGPVAGGLLCVLPDGRMFLAQIEKTKQKPGTIFHRKLFMNHLLQRIFEIIGSILFNDPTVLFEVWHVLIFTNGQEITCCNPFNFSNAWNSTGTSNHLRLGNSQEIKC